MYVNKSDERDIPAHVNEALWLKPRRRLLRRDEGRAGNSWRSVAHVASNAQPGRYRHTHNPRPPLSLPGFQRHQEGTRDTRQPAQREHAAGAERPRTPGEEPGEEPGAQGLPSGGGDKRPLLSERARVRAPGHSPSPAWWPGWDGARGRARPPLTPQPLGGPGSVAHRGLQSQEACSRGVQPGGWGPRPVPLCRGAPSAVL